MPAIGSLLDTATLAAADPRDGAPWDWARVAYDVFAARLLGPDPGYPCHFGVRGQQAGHNSFAMLDERPGPFSLDALAEALLLFRERAWTGPKRQSLVVFVGPPRRSILAEDHQRFWELLARLGDRDQRPWPAHIPADPEHPAWQWCFGGEPWFTFVCSPNYVRRRSRNLGPCLTMVFQTRRVFEGLGGETRAGRAAKAQVRANVVAYDAVGPHPYLGDAGHSSSAKWRQYALPDDQRISQSRCPFPTATTSTSGGIREIP